MRRIHRSRWLLAFALTGLALAPLPLAAQEPQQTHTVRPGDTLWDLAQLYLGDPFRWPEIYRRNTATVQDPDLIYPDQVLIISGDIAPTPGTPADSAMVVDSAMVADTTAAGRAVQDSLAAMQQPVYVRKSMTIFNPDRFRVVRGSRESLVLRTRTSAVRAGDYLRAPFIVGTGGIEGAGRLDATTSSDAVGITLSQRSIQPYDRVYVQVPDGAAGAREERFLLFRYGPNLQGEGKIVIPTGIIKLTAEAENGRAQAVLLTKFEDVFEGHRLTQLDTLTERFGVFPARVEFGLVTKLLWMYQNPVLPTIGHQLIFAAGEADGLVSGDQITVQKEMGRDARGVPLPPEDLAVVQVTRVTEWGASAIIIGMADGGLLKGQAARVTAKMP